MLMLVRHARKNFVRSAATDTRNRARKTLWGFVAYRTGDMRHSSVRSASPRITECLWMRRELHLAVAQNLQLYRKFEYYELRIKMAVEERLERLTISLRNSENRMK